MDKTRNIILSSVLLFFLSLSTASYSRNFSGLVTPINNREYFKKVMPLLSEAEESISVIMYLASYYDAYPDSPTNIILRQLAESAQNGIKIKVILNQTQRQYSRQSQPENLKTALFLAGKGVPVYFDSHERTTHSKLIIVDSRYVIIGSANWTYSAMEKNNESSVIIDSKELAGFYNSYFQEIKKECSVYIKPVAEE